jgi:hypothetical protein
MPATCSCEGNGTYKRASLSFLHLSKVIINGALCTASCIVNRDDYFCIWSTFVLVDFVGKHHCSLLYSAGEPVLTGTDYKHTSFGQMRKTKAKHC